MDANDNLLSSVEFYSISGESWQTLRSLRQPRTEHGWGKKPILESLWAFRSLFIPGMAWISGMAAVMGGVSEKEFLKSIEFLDNSAEEGAELDMDWRIAAHDLSRPRCAKINRHTRFSLKFQKK